MRESNRLSDAKIKAAIKKAMLTDKSAVLYDGDGLRLKVGSTGNARWVLRITDKRTRKAREPGLGPYPKVTLRMARDLAYARRKEVREGIDPVASQRAERRGVVTFMILAEQEHERRLKQWGNAKHRNQWINTLKAYAFPVIGNMPVGEIQNADVRKILLPIWHTKEETARRVLQRIKVVLEVAIAEGLRATPNAANIAGLALGKQRKQVRHHPAVPWLKIPAFVRLVRSSPSGMAARLALEFLLLTAARTKEVIYARWSEIDYATETWAVPAERMKRRREHRVPLSGRAVAILREAQEHWPHSRYIFPGRHLREPMSNATMEQLMKRLPRDETPHGLRSSFKDWGSDNGKDRGLLEVSLSHVLPGESEAEAAYRRTDFLERRRPLMQEWADYVCSQPKAQAEVDRAKALAAV